MNIWVLTVFRVSRKAKRLVKSIEDRVEKIALDAFGITTEQYERIINLNDEKRKIINLAVLKTALCDSVKERDLDALSRYSCGETAGEIAKDCAVGESAVRKRIKRAIESCITAMQDMGFDEKRMEREYGSLDCVSLSRRAIERKTKLKRLNAYKKL